ncbi:MAG: hypothetical protein A2511_04050 [Deltaproteobacteria bacterium RIFOXYD12_FULL_50_9]|nr:MAG: hypothetical protein A2511_04050 [Deltaproteobacteria bacterium RIFOXYD12_FULL_50_9]
MAQLNLFEWDIVAVSKGFDSLARLDFNQARSYFSRVLEAYPGHPEAGRGMRDLQVWENVLRDLEGPAEESAISLFWDKIGTFHFRNSESYQNLWHSLIKHLLTLFDGRATLYTPPDLCSGYLYLQLKDYSAAESHLRVLVESLPENGRLHGYLADAIWMQGRQEIANTVYAKALLLTPDQVNISSIRNPQLAKIIQEYGPAIAPIIGFMEGLLPLIKQDIAPTTQEARTYEILWKAERARLFGIHDEMVAARADLKTIAPEIFQDYLDWLVIE